VLDNLAEKMDKCPAVELGVPRYPLKKKKKKKKIAHGPSISNMPVRVDKDFKFQSL